ncbi:MAG: metal-dependent hydrolase [Acidiferrobacterales bacterium]|jgi:inner membrane protein
MDTLTHALSGALLARATAPAEPTAGQLSAGKRTLVGFIAAVFPDSDFILRFIDPLTYLNLHRSYLNSVLLWPLWAILLAFIFSLLFRRRYSWRAFVGVCFLAIGIHILGDVITSFGTMIFAPISFMRVAWPTTFIIDPYFSVIIVAGLITSALWKRSRAPAVASLIVLAAYVGFQGLLLERAEALAQRYAHANELADASAYALPQPLSPFNWMLVVVHGSTYHIARVSLLRNEVPDAAPADAGALRRIAASYRPVAHALWQRKYKFGGDASLSPMVEAAWRQDVLRPYREFALFPALYRIDHNGDNTCVWFRDLRFALAGRGPIFPFGLCRDDAASPWRLHQLSTVNEASPLID